ncbi:hypothetical protein C8R43DRAFT_1110283 [Mycena crocata]|nr:hypothetical protein C8R43DRAFT_1110283 [Mycena crocata]
MIDEFPDHAEERPTELQKLLYIAAPAMPLGGYFDGSDCELRVPLVAGDGKHYLFLYGRDDMYRFDEPFASHDDFCAEVPIDRELAKLPVPYLRYRSREYKDIYGGLPLDEALLDPVRSSTIHMYAFGSHRNSPSPAHPRRPPPTALHRAHGRNRPHCTLAHNYGPPSRLVVRLGQLVRRPEFLHRALLLQPLALTGALEPLAFLEAKYEETFLFAAGGAYHYWNAGRGSCSGMRGSGRGMQTLWHGWGRIRWGKEGEGDAGEVHAPEAAWAATVTVDEGAPGACGHGEEGQSAAAQETRGHESGKQEILGVSGVIGTGLRDGRG